MGEIVRIKSFSKGLNIQLDDAVSFDEILSTAARKFREGKQFFGNSYTVVSFTGRKLSDLEEMQLIDAIRYNCDLKIICTICEDERQDQLFMKAMAEIPTDIKKEESSEETYPETYEEMYDDVQVFRGDLSDGEKLDTTRSIIILGDVYGGCSITSEKNILILGTLYGTARAGSAGDNHAFIIAMEMAPEELSIGDFTYDMSRKKQWTKKKKEGTMVAARIQEDTIILDEYTKEFLNDF